MALMDATIKMTSNTAPAPYVVSASSEYSSSFPAYKAFNGANDASGACWLASTGKVSGEWIKIDFGGKVKITDFGITNLLSSGSAYLQTGLKSFELQGSNDDSEWVTIKRLDNELVWGNAEFRRYELNKIYQFRYYRIYVYENYGYTCACADEIKFFLNTEIEEEIPPVSHKNASLLYTIPMNTTQNILAKTNDPRVGLLGMANDAENYGDLYVIGGDGKSHLTRSGIKSEVIFDGSAGSVGSYNLTKDINIFSYLIVLAKINHGSELFDDSTSTVVYKSEFANMKFKCISTYWNSDTYYGIEYRLSDKTLTFQAISTGSGAAWLTPHIYKVIGVY